MRFLVLAGWLVGVMTVGGMTVGGMLVGGMLVGGMTVGRAMAADDLTPLESEERPKCEKATRTQFWPEEANSDAREAMRLAREGKLLICTRGAWRYGWRPVALNLRAAVAEERAKEKR